MTADGEIRLHQDLEAFEPQLLHHRREAVDRGAARKPAQHRPAVHLDRLRQDGGGLLRASVHEQFATLGEQFVKSLEVELRRPHAEHVSRRFGQDIALRPFGVGEKLPQLRYVHVQARVRPSRLIVAPQFVEEPICRYYLIVTNQQCSQKDLHFR
jgi:hypothetical protein